MKLMKWQWMRWGCLCPAWKMRNITFPKASELDTVDSEDGVLVIVEFDMAEYRRKNGSKAVKEDS